MADAGDRPSSSDVDLDKSDLKSVNNKQRLAKQAEVEVVEEAETSRMASGQSHSWRATASQAADNGEDQSPNSDESDRTVVDAGQYHFRVISLTAFSLTCVVNISCFSSCCCAE